jgi:hypothetical protein
MGDAGWMFTGYRRRRYHARKEALMAAPVLCAVCEKTEEFCDCEKYCTICKGQYGIRLCTDGLYYCPDCREACEMRLANELTR